MNEECTRSWPLEIFLKTWHPFFWIILTCFLLYSQTISYDFSYLDDHKLIVNNYTFLKNPANISRTLTEDIFRLEESSNSYYRPLYVISFMLDAWMGGKSPWIYHLTNLIAHAIASCLLFTFLSKLGHKSGPAFFFSLIFAVHPVATQTVCWIPARNDSFLAVFVLSSFIFFSDFLKKGRRHDYVFHLVFLVLALFMKESALALIPICILYVLILERPSFPKIRTKKSAIEEGIRLLSSRILAIEWLVIAASWYILRMKALNNLPENNLVDATMALLISVPGIIQLFGKTLLPFNLSVLPTFQDTVLLYGYIAILIISITLFLTKQKCHRHIIWGFLWFLCFLLPSFALPDISKDVRLMEHRMYLPAIGLILVWLETDLVKKPNLWKKKVPILDFIILIVFSCITFAHSQVFRNRKVFWESAVKTAPHSSLAHGNVGVIYYLEGQADRAEKEYLKSLELNPLQSRPHINLGIIYMEKNNFLEAEREFKTAIRINPQLDMAYYHLGLLYHKWGKEGEAMASWKKMQELNPQFLDIYKGSEVQ